MDLKSILGDATCVYSILQNPNFNVDIDMFVHDCARRSFNMRCTRTAALPGTVNVPQGAALLGR
jgi:hypothetical protein